SYGNYLGMGYATNSMTKAVSQEATSSGSAPTAVSSDTGRTSSDYSKTNIQVEGVDEPDFVKNDGKYIYVVSGRKLYIVDAYPAESSKIISQLEFNGTPQDILINGDRMTVFGYQDYDYSSSGVSIPEIGIMPRRQYSPRTFVKVYDLTDRANPILKRNVSVDGNYYDSRMIGDYVYAIVNQPVYYSDPTPIPMPMIESNGVTKTVAASDIYYFDYPDNSYIFTNIVALNVKADAEEVSTKTFLMGYSENMYVSQSNIYIVYTKRLNDYDFYDKIIDEAIMPSMPVDVQVKIGAIRASNSTKYEKIQQIGGAISEYLDSLNPEDSASIMKIVETRMQTVQEEISKEIEKTVIHKISVNGPSIEYMTNGQVPGYTLNQFSMDEYNGNFRIATTTGNWRSESLNHVYVLDGNLNITGKVEDLAHGERIYSVRFMGNKAYMVTFRQMDPLFVIDLSIPTDPKVLGYLKIPGVSDYLHPYDENHVIGIGRDATDQGRVQGMKLSLFDVSDVSNPTEVSKYIIGDSGTYSEALYDHKAFLFDRDKNLLVIPVSTTTYPRGPEVSAQQPEYWQGAYVFNLDLANGFVLKGKITHENQTANKTDYYYYDYNTQIRRSLFIDSILYTVSNNMIKANRIDSLSEVGAVLIPHEDQYYPYRYMNEGTVVGVAEPMMVK
ncbi:MAG: beta-propeller domain-containing protein, partial [Candidatus Aenigmatarchaeota archaeon]